MRKSNGLCRIYISRPCLGFGSLLRNVLFQVGTTNLSRRQAKLTIFTLHCSYVPKVLSNDMIHSDWSSYVSKKSFATVYGSTFERQSNPPLLEGLANSITLSESVSFPNKILHLHPTLDHIRNKLVLLVCFLYLLLV